MKTRKTKIKYWTACVSMPDENAAHRVGLLCTGGCYYSLREAVAAMPNLNSSRAAVVRAGRDEMPTTDVIRHI